MFSREETEALRDLPWLSIVRTNGHDVTLRGTATGHEWIIVTGYGRRTCYILHRHTAQQPFHRQAGCYRDLAAAIEFILRHERWSAGKKKSKNKRNHRKTISNTHV